MARVGNPHPAGSFQAASGIDPADLAQIIGILALTACAIWAGIYLRRVFWYGWQRGDFGHIGMGVLLAATVLLLVTLAVTHY